VIQQRLDEADHVRLNLWVGTADQELRHPARPDAVRTEEVLPKYSKSAFCVRVARQQTLPCRDVFDAGAIVTHDEVEIARILSRVRSR
jgi:hypothetical protein